LSVTVVVIPLGEDDEESFPPQQTAAIESLPVVPHLGPV
jgi:hypothetical protein